MFRVIIAADADYAMLIARYAATPLPLMMPDASAGVDAIRHYFACRHTL